MFSSILTLIILYLIFRYIIAWIEYYNNTDDRLQKSVWRYSYDYPVVGKRDISDLDDKKFVRLRRFRNLIVTLMYCTVFIFFIVFMSFTSHILILIIG
ncbi:hypothetical protein N9X11_02280 [Candidatus Pelagibacter bacterium]|jgi:hypothetical protein|nr:hypothetical protein [Candidatus Pelagibacter bacterium]